MSQAIEAPSDADVSHLAHQLLHARQLVVEATGKELTGRESDIALLQQAIDSGSIEKEATYSLQALGIAFGKVFIENQENFDWWMAEDEYGRDPVIRYKETTLILFPQTMISNRIEDGKPVDLQALYEGLLHHVEELRAEHYLGQ